MQRKRIEPKLALCVDCNDNKPKQCIGKREKARCKRHYWEHKKKSVKQIALDRQFAKKKKEHLEKYPDCQLNVEGLCIGKAIDVHHTRGHGVYYLDETTYLSGCRPCHRYVNDHSQYAYDNNLAEKRLNKY